MTMNDKQEHLHQHIDKLQKCDPKDFSSNLEKFLAATLKVEAGFQTRCRNFKNKKEASKWIDKLTGKIKLDDDMLMSQAEHYEKQMALFMADTTCSLACDFDHVPYQAMKFDVYYKMNEGLDGIFLSHLSKLKAMAGFKDPSFEGGDEFLCYCCNLNLVKAVYWYYVASVHGNPRARAKVNELISQNCLAELSAVFDESFLGVVAADPKSSVAKAKALQLEQLQGSLHEIFKGDFKSDINKFLFVWNNVAGPLNGTTYGSKLKLYVNGKRSSVSYLPYAYLGLMKRLLIMAEDLEQERLKNSKSADYSAFYLNLGTSLSEMINALSGPGEAERFNEMEQRFAMLSEARHGTSQVPSDLICSKQDAENYDPLYLCCNLLKNLASLRCSDDKTRFVKPLLIDEDMFGMPPHAAYLIGLDYIQGKNLPKNLMLGLNFLRYAHSCGHPYAAASLAFYQEELPGEARNGKSLVAMTDAVLSSIYNVRDLIGQNVAPVAVFDPQDLKHDDTNPLLLLCASYFDMLSSLAQGQELFGYSVSDRRRIFSEQSLYAVKAMMSAMHRPEYNDEACFDAEDDDFEDDEEQTDLLFENEDDAPLDSVDKQDDDDLDLLLGPVPKPVPVYRPEDGKANLCEIALIRLCSCGTALPYDYYRRLAIMLRQMIQDRFDSLVPGRRTAYDQTDSALVFTLKKLGYGPFTHEGIMWGPLLAYAEKVMAKAVFDSSGSCSKLKAYYLSFWLRHAVYFSKSDYKRVSQRVRERFDAKTLNEILALPCDKFATVFYELAMALKLQSGLFAIDEKQTGALYGQALRLSCQGRFGPALGQAAEDFLASSSKDMPKKPICATNSEALEIAEYLIGHGCIGQGLSLAKRACNRMGDHYHERCYDRLEYEYRAGKREAYKETERKTELTFIDSYFGLIKHIKTSASINYADEYAALISFLPLSSDEIAFRVRDFLKSRSEDDPCSMEAAMFLGDYDLNQADGGANSSPTMQFRSKCTLEGGLSDGACRAAMASYRYRLGKGLQPGACDENVKVEIRTLNKTIVCVLAVLSRLEDHPGPLEERMKQHLYSSNLLHRTINRFVSLGLLYQPRFDAMNMFVLLSDKVEKHFSNMRFERDELFYTQVPLKRSFEAESVSGLLALMGPVFEQDNALQRKGPQKGGEVLSVRMQMRSFLVPIDPEVLKSDCLKSFNGADVAAGVFGSLHEKFWTVPALKAGAMTYSEDQADYFASVVSSKVKQ